MDGREFMELPDGELIRVTDTGTELLPLARNRQSEGMKRYWQKRRAKKETCSPVGEMSAEVYQNHLWSRHKIAQGMTHDEDHRLHPDQVDHVHPERVVPVAEILQEKINWHPTVLPLLQVMPVNDIIRHLASQHDQRYVSMNNHDQHHRDQPDIFGHIHKAEELPPLWRRHHA
jgi:hypothetical protein